jgi:type I restriction enzyme S subunit
MNKLEQLIKTYCPNGPDYIKIGDVVNYEQPSKCIVKSTDYKDEFDTPVLTAGQTFILGYTNETTGIYKASKENPVIIFDDFTGAFKWVDFSFKVKSSAMKMLTTSTKDVLLRYIYHVMGNLNFTSDEHKRLWISVYSEFQIPVPPLPVQEEIVRILDKFTELEAELAQKLAQEVEYRKQQYAFYRDRLLSFESPIKMKTVQQLINEQLINIITPSFKIKRNDYCESGLVPIISQEAEYISGYFDKKDSKITKRNYVCFGDHSEHIKFIDFEFVQGADGLKIMHANEHSLLSRYLYHALSNFYTRHDNYERHFKYLTDTTIPVPSVDVQQRLVNVLDNFDAICSDLSIGLPAEIAARESQYFYYRDLLFNYAANGLDLSRAEQSRAEQSRAEQSRAEQSRAEQSRAELTK